MSEYKDFSRCIICRSKTNLDNYHGEFEVTMLLNTLYMTVMYPIEKRREIHAKSSEISKWLTDHGIVDNCGNQHNCDDIVRYLRNGLAHYNISVTGDPIKDIRIEAKNLPVRAACKEPCTATKCIPTPLKEVNRSICTFNFTIKTLKEFTEFLIEHSLQQIPDDICNQCPYKE